VRRWRQNRGDTNGSSDIRKHPKTLLCDAGAKTGVTPKAPNSLKDSEKSNKCMGSIPNLKVHVFFHDSAHIRGYAWFHEVPPVLQAHSAPGITAMLRKALWSYPKHSAPDNAFGFSNKWTSENGRSLKSSASITTPLILQDSVYIRRCSQLLSAPETSKVPVVSVGTIDSFDSCNPPKRTVKTSGTSCTWRRR
jgi:hypothetical protein